MQRGFAAREPLESSLRAPLARCVQLAPLMSSSVSYPSGVTRHAELNRYVNLKLAALGEPASMATTETELMALAGPFVRNHFEKDELLGWPLCPVDLRIQGFSR